MRRASGGPRERGRSRVAAGSGLAGGLLGVVAGLIQATVGDRIPEWTGNKQAPVALGLLTIGLSLVAMLVAAVQRRPHLSSGARAACALGLAGPGLLGLSTVGRLWYLPAVLLVVAAVLTIDGWRDTAAAVAAAWWRVLLGALGGWELLMAAGAAPATFVVGAVGGVGLVAAAGFDPRPAWRGWVLVAVGTVPFAALAWTAVVPLLVAVEALFVFAVSTHQRSSS